MSEVDQSVLNHHVNHTADNLARLISELSANPLRIEPSPSDEGIGYTDLKYVFNDVVNLLLVDKRSIELVKILLETRQLWQEGDNGRWGSAIYMFENPTQTKRETITKFSKLKIYIEKKLDVIQVHPFKKYVDARQISRTSNTEHIILIRDLNDLLFLCDNIILALNRIPDYDAYQLPPVPHLVYKILQEAMDSCFEWEGDAAEGITETLKATAMIMLDAEGAYGTPKTTQKTIANILMMRSAWYSMFMEELDSDSITLRTYTNNHMYREMVRGFKRCINQMKDWLEPRYNSAKSIDSDTESIYDTVSFYDDEVVRNTKNDIIKFLDDTERALKLRLDVSRI